jgi:hypothetical protein
VNVSFLLVSFFLFHSGLLIPLISIQFRAEPGTIPTSRSLSSGLTSADSWLQLNWKSREAVSQRRISPCGLFSRAEDALKRRLT